MNLFNIVPQNYFSIFQGKNREIYIESLSILYSLLQNDETFIRKVDFLNALKDREKDLSLLDLTEEEISDEEKENLKNDYNNSSKASYIVRKLEECGWIDISMDIDNYEEIVILPPYSISLLKTFSDIVSDEESPYISLVHSTYSELKLEDEDMDELLYPTLLRCYENTKKLKVELITLTHSIRIFQNKLSKLFDTNEVLHSYFDIYKRKISDRYYHPLKTFDSVAKYKRPIIKILNHWLETKEIREKLIFQASINSKSNNKKEIEADIIEKINYISDTYETLNSLIASIDKENNAYTKSSTQKILYLNNADHTVKGHLENIFKHYANKINEPRELAKVLSKMQDSFTLYEQGYLDSESVSLPIMRKYKEIGEPMEIQDFSDIDDYLKSSFLEETSNMYTDEKIYSFMEREFGRSREITTEDFNIENFDELICLILATVKSEDENSFYKIDEIYPNAGIITNYFLIPNVTFIRREKEKENK